MLVLLSDMVKKTTELQNIISDSGSLNVQTINNASMNVLQGFRCGIWIFFLQVFGQIFDPWYWNIVQVW